MACAPSDLATDASCFTCQNERLLRGMTVYLLAQIAKAANPALDITPSGLAGPANQYSQELSGKLLLGAEVYLLCQISGA